MTPLKRPKAKRNITKPRPEYWSIFGAYGDNALVCTQHRTLRQAIKEALRCERTGGAPHTIVQVTPLGTAKELKR